jgi:hypothetical protein
MKASRGAARPADWSSLNGGNGCLTMPDLDRDTVLEIARYLDQHNARYYARRLLVDHAGMSLPVADDFLAATRYAPKEN